jgi:hypothetical protein
LVCLVCTIVTRIHYPGFLKKDIGDIANYGANVAILIWNHCSGCHSGPLGNIAPKNAKIANISFHQMRVQMSP